MAQGYLLLVLHAHLPYVRHLDRDDYLEERWLFEAITETYVPLLEVFLRLANDRVPFCLTLSLSPTLLSMFLDPLLQTRYLNHLARMEELAEKEVFRTRYDRAFSRLAYMYKKRLCRVYHLYHEIYKDNLITAFRELAEAGYLELITCAATHAYLPLLGLQREVVNAQVRIAADFHARLFGSYPPGMWLPECGYNPGDDDVLAAAGLRYFFLDTHGILFARPRPRYGVFAPVFCPSGVAAFGRDPESSKQVWSAQEGYPGDYDYREFYRDIGYDLDWEYIGPYVHPSGIRVDTGFKYYRITGKTDHKEPYVPERAGEKAAIHAGNFMFNRERQIEWLASRMDRKPVVVAPYDAELFGHWWFEGPQWLEVLFRKISRDQKVFALTTPTRYLAEYPRNQTVIPCLSSWGNEGYNEVWLSGANDWIYRHLHHAAAQMVELANTFTAPTPLERRALNQAARELLLAQSSDWPFIMKTGTMVEYATKRLKTHLLRFRQLVEDLCRRRVDELWLEQVEKEDNLFPDLSYTYFRSSTASGSPAGSRAN
jgi:1,4-alpha-glucan branching enzyme